MATIGPIEVRVRDAKAARLFVHELETLRDDMRVGASPFAERLERAIDRFVDGDDEGGGEVLGGDIEVVVEETVDEVVVPCPKCVHGGES